MTGKMNALTYSQLIRHGTDLFQKDPAPAIDNLASGYFCTTLAKAWTKVS